jgi:hypothetical protein
MKTFLFDKPSVQNAKTVFLAKFRMLFTKVTGYDLIFESSRRDIKPLRGI